MRMPANDIGDEPARIAQRRMTLWFMLLYVTIALLWWHHPFAFTDLGLVVLLITLGRLGCAYIVRMEPRLWWGMILFTGVFMVPPVVLALPH